MSDTDISLVQECVALATDHPALSVFWTDAITLVLLLMTAQQRDTFRFDRLYPQVVERAILGGTEDDPIVVDEVA